MVHESDILEYQTTPLTRLTLALFCGGSGDHYPLHVDTDWVVAHTDRNDVIGHGMLTMAWLVRPITDRFRPEQVKEVSARFLAPSHIGDIITCTATPSGPARTDAFLRYDLTARSQNQTLLARGSATVLIPDVILVPVEKK